MLDTVVAFARELATDLIDAAEGGDPGKRAEAAAVLDEGDALRDDGRFKDAVAKYRVAHSKAADAER